MRIGITVVILTGLAILVLLAGCIGGGGGGLSDDAPLTQTTGTTTLTPADERVTATTTIKYDSIDYFATNDSVRIVVTGSGITEVVPFERWAIPTCTEASQDEIRQLVITRLQTSMDTDRTVLNHSVHVGPENETAIAVEHTTNLDRNGDVISTPGVSRTQLEKVTPKTITMTINLENRSYTCTKQIVIREVVTRLA